MAIESDARTQSIKVIDDYLAVAKMLCDDPKLPWGYSAALLLLCAIDAMGNGLLKRTGD